MRKVIHSTNRAINPDNIVVPDDVYSNWQEIVNLIAGLVGTQSALINRLHTDSIEIYVSSTNQENKLPVGLSGLLGSKYYCETVAEQKKMLLIPNARNDPKWADGPDLSLDLISYLGFPLTWPTGKVFGTLCVLDNKENPYNENYIKLMDQFSNSIKQTLKALYESQILKHENIFLSDSNANLEKAKNVAENANIANQVKSDFLTAISHELRTPLHGILGGIQVAQIGAKEPLLSTLDLIYNSASEMVMMVNDILTYTEVQSGILSLLETDTHFSSISKILQQRYKLICESKGLKLIWDLNSDPEDILLFDQDKLLTILDKLLGNAVNFTRTGSIAVKVNLDKKADWQLTCVIKDTGIGIDSEDCDDILKAFQQKEGGFQRNYGGLGLGLTISKKLIEVMNGHLTIESEKGVGSTFTVSVPVSKGSYKEKQVELKLPPSAQVLPILVVEDNIINQKILVKMLDKIGYQCIVAENGQEALEILESHMVSLILLDLQMPVMDGFAFTVKMRQLKDVRSTIPIIAVTANQMDTDKNACINSGMDDFLQKPVSLHSLQETLNHYVKPFTTYTQNMITPTPHLKTH